MRESERDERNLIQSPYGTHYIDSCVVSVPTLSEFKLSF